MIDGERLARLGLDSAASRMQSPNPGLETTIQQRPTELALLKLQQSRTRTTRTTNYKQLLSKDQQHCCFFHNSTNVVISIGQSRFHNSAHSKYRNSTEILLLRGQPDGAIQIQDFQAIFSFFMQTGGRRHRDEARWRVTTCNAPILVVGHLPVSSRHCLPYSA